MNSYPTNYPMHGFHPCNGCGNMAPHHSQEGAPDNGWSIPVDNLGYYGGFTDALIENESNTINLCHDCVIKFIETFPMIGLLIGKGGHSQIGPNEKPCCAWAWKSESINNSTITYLASEDGQQWLAQ
jgi:hypothetical protein